MHVGYSCQLLRAPSFGVGNCIQELACALVRTAGDGDRLTFYAHDRIPALGDPPAGAAVEMDYSTHLTRNRLPRILWEQAVLPGRARRARLDLLHAPGYVMPIAARTPAVLTVYDLLALTRPALCKPTNRWHYRLFLPPSIDRARRVIVPSQAVRTQLIERFPLDPARIEVIAPGVGAHFLATPSDESLAEVRARHRLPRHFVLFAGSFEPKKNLPRLIDAFSHARRQGAVDGSLVLVGGGGWGNVLAGRRETPGLEIRSFVPAGDLPAIYRLARMLAFPSLAEGFGLPVVEAMACGLPVLCSDVPALIDGDLEAAVRVDPASVESIAGGIARLWRDGGLRAAIARRGLEAAKHLSWDEAARRTWRVYREAVGSGRAPAG